MKQVLSEQQENKLMESDADLLYELISEVLEKWTDANNDDLIPSTECVVPLVFHRILSYHYAHHFELSSKGIKRYLSMLEDSIYQQFANSTIEHDHSIEGQA
ncbi:MAG: hypothetical protein Unbinned3325contig1000_14 [Prokaryotic dsDNA virus sp.]|nr:MAG: hypothetical protein Unbinned3325contig1000_14 [Prokaryotic dsDNA virus sp.]